MSFSYHDYPEGEDTLRKMAYTSRYAMILGLYKSTMDVLLVSSTPPVGFASVASKIFSATTPFVAAAALGTGVISLSTNLRKKDDSLNYFIGGLSGGFSYGLFRGKVAAMLGGAAICGILAHAYKYNRDLGVVFEKHDEVVANDVDVWYKKEDYFLTRQPPKEWVAGK